MPIMSTSVTRDAREFAKARGLSIAALMSRGVHYRADLHLYLDRAARITQVASHLFAHNASHLF
jgi:hypothetical protein